MAEKHGRDYLKGVTKTPGDFNLMHRFNVEIDGVTMGGIKKVEGLESEHEMVSYKDGDQKHMQVRAGRQNLGTLTLERDFSSTNEFFNWFKSVIDGNVDRKSISIVYLADDGTEATRINLYDAWPKSWKVNGLNARQSGHASETVEVVYEKIAFG
jgi:phage tail-like protein